MSRRKEMLQISIFFIFLVCIFFYKVVFLGDKWLTTNLLYHFSPWNSMAKVDSNTLLSDPVDSWLPMLNYWRGTLLHGRLPLWNPWTAMGAPFYYSATAVTGYFLNWIFMILPLSTALGLHAMIRLFISAIGIYLFLRELNLNKVSAIVGAISYTFSGPMIVWLNWPHTYVSVFAPFLMYIIEKMIKTGSLKYLIAGAFVLATMFYGYMPAYVAYFLYIAGIYFLTRMTDLFPLKNNMDTWIRRTFQFGSLVILGLGLAAYHLIPFLDLMTQTGYISERANLYETSLGLNYLITYFAPKIYIGTYIKVAHFNEYTGYIGITALLFAGMTIFKTGQHRKIICVFGVAALLLFSIIYGAPTILALKYMPILNSSASSRLVMPLDFILSLLAALSIDAFIRNPDVLRNKVIPYLAVFALFVTGLMIYENELYGNKLNFISVERFTIIYLTLNVLMLLYVYQKIKVKLFAGLLVFVVVFDMFLFGIHYNPTVPEKLAAPLYPKTDSISFLQSNLGNYRFTALGTWTIFPNTAMIYNLEDVRGHDFIQRGSRVVNYLQGIDLNAYTTKTRTEINEIRDKKLLDLAGVKYILSESRLDERKVELNPLQGSKVPVGEIYGSYTVKQSFISVDNNIKGIEVLLANYQRQLKATPVFLQVYDESGRMVAQDNVLASQIKDNSYQRFNFPPIKDSRDKKFVFVISSPGSSPGNAITAWISKDNSFKDGQASNERTLLPGDLYFDAVYSKEKPFKFIKKSNDGLYIFENPDAVPKTYFVTDAKKQQGKDIIPQLDSLDASKEILLEGTKHSGQRPGAPDAKVQLTKYEPEDIRITVSTGRSGLLVLDDPYYPGWTACVDGKIARIYRANYLFRAVPVSAGVHRVEFRFRPKSIGYGLYITLVSLGLTVLLILFSLGDFIIKKQNQCYIEKNE